MQAAYLIPNALAKTAPQVLAGSEFVIRTLQREPNLLDTLQDDILRSYVDKEYECTLAKLLIKVQDEMHLHFVLRRFRRHQMLRIIWRDLANLATLEETLADLSALADVCVIQTTELLYAWQIRDLGYPENANGQQQQLIILAMGKLGAKELNLSSDIDLIFAFPSHGPVRRANGGLNPIDSQQFFQRLSQRLIQALQQPSAEGFVFRVDVRLRPFGDAGPLVLSIDALEDYYQTQARDWERYAMVKARPLTGDAEAIEQLMRILNAFVYRRYLDFAAIDSLRAMKRLIQAEVTRKGREHDIKLGLGGIREIEFIGQVFQIIRGGREPELQIRPILAVLAILAAKGLLPVVVVEELSAAYKFLRRVENRLQAWRDQQTHVVPEDAPGQLRLAQSMGYIAWEQFATDLNAQRQLVQQHFDTVFAQPQEEHQPNLFNELWHGNLEVQQAQSVLATAGFVNPTEVLQQLRNFNESPACRTLGGRGRTLLDQLLPKILEAVAPQPVSDQVLERLLRLIETIARRTTYLALLVERPVALTQLIRLAAASPWIIEQLARYPLLLDELLDPRRLYSPQRHQELLVERDSLLKSVSLDDQEQQIERLNQFVHSNRLRIAAADLTGVIPLMVVSDYLTDLAEVVIDTALTQCWDYLTRRHGQPLHGSTSSPNSSTGSPHGFAVIGYGKLGGIELGYGSDLDLVFLYENKKLLEKTDGSNPIATDLFYSRLSQRLIHTLNTRTAAGIIYEIDTRLRPNGNAGLLVSSVDAFAHYQVNSAWTWEHQALLRARPIAGDPTVRTQFRNIRLIALTQQHDSERLKQEVWDMREKMRTQLDRSRAGVFDLKQGLGGIVDIEFLVQYQVLRYAQAYPELLDWTDTIRWLETLARHALLPSTQAEILANSYRALRGATHRLTLQNAPHLIPDTELGVERAQVRSIWQMGEW